MFEDRQTDPNQSKFCSPTQTNFDPLNLATLPLSMYKHDSKEQQTKKDAIAKWLPMIEDEDFLLMEPVERRLTGPKKTKIYTLIDKHYEHERQKTCVMFLPLVTVHHCKRVPLTITLPRFLWVKASQSFLLTLN